MNILIDILINFIVYHRKYSYEHIQYRITVNKLNFHFKVEYE
jgi:hypothetical protein